LGLRGGCGVGCGVGFGVGVGVGLGGWLAVVVLGCVSGGAGVCFTCVCFFFILRCTKYCKIFSGLFS
jgi:hypothetical protein